MSGCGKKSVRSKKSIIDRLHSNLDSNKFSLMRISTGQQDIDRQEFLNNPRLYQNVISITGSAFKKDTAVKQVMEQFSENKKEIQLNLVDLDRLVSNVAHLWHLYDFLLTNEYTLHINIVDNQHNIKKSYDLITDIQEIQNIVRLAYCERHRKSVRMKWLHRNNRINYSRTPKPELVHFRRYACWIFNEDHLPVSAPALAKMYNSVGVKISVYQIQSWREKYSRPDEDSYYGRCNITNMKLLAHKEDLDEDFSYLLYKDYIPDEETAIRFAKLNTHIIWEDGLSNMNSLEEAIDTIEDEDTMSEPEIINHDAAPASDILDKIKNAHDMKEKGILSDAEFIAFKKSLLK